MSPTPIPVPSVPVGPFDTRIVSNDFFTIIKFFFSWMWKIFNAFEIPGTGLRPIHLVIGALGFVVVVNFIKKILNQGDMHDAPGMFIKNDKYRDYTRYQNEKRYQDYKRSMDSKNKKSKGA